MKYINAIKFIRKHKLSAWVNIFGLSIALTLCLMLLVYVKTETSVDRFHANSDKIYRVVSPEGCAFSPPFGQYIMDNISGVKAYSRTFLFEAVVRYGNNIIRTPNCFIADTNFFSFFSFPLVKGTPGKVLEAKNNILVSESFARKLFGNTDPVGKAIRYNNRLTFIVNGIFKDFAENTHFKKADVILPYSTADDLFYKGYLTQFNERYFLTGLYVLADSHVNLENKGDDLYRKVKPWYWLFQNNRNTYIKFQPLTEAYFNPVPYGFPLGAREGNKRLLNLIVLIVVGISLISSINYVNLAIAQSFNRIKELAIKRVSGASDWHILMQSLAETFTFFFISFLLAIALLIIGLPVFNELVGYHVTLGSLFSSWLIVKIFCAVLLASIVVGLVPSFALLRLAPASSLRKSFSFVSIGTIQKALLVLQYTISITLIIALIVIIKQRHFLEDFDTGFKSKKIFYIKLNSQIKDKKLDFRDEIKKISGVNGVSLCNSLPEEGILEWKFEYLGKAYCMDEFNIDNEFFKLLDVHLQYPPLPDKKSCWISSSAAKLFGVKSRGEIIEFEQNKKKITKVVNEILPDLHFRSLYEKPRPSIFTPINTKDWVDYVLVKVQNESAAMVLPQIRSLYKKFAPDFPFEITFLDSKMNEAYERESKTSQIVFAFALFGIFISSMGSFTLAYYASQRRTKEIGIRKVNGAKTWQIVTMLIAGFIKQIILAVIIAFPLGWYIMNNWLQNFAYRTEFSWWILVVAGIIIIVATIFSVTWQSWRAANRNPVESLRYE